MSYDSWKLASPPEPDEPTRGCLTCSHMFDLDGLMLCCVERDHDGTDGSVYVATGEFERLCLRDGLDWEEA